MQVHRGRQNLLTILFRKSRWALPGDFCMKCSKITQICIDGVAGYPVPPPFHRHLPRGWMNAGTRKSEFPSEYIQCARCAAEGWFLKRGFSGGILIAIAHGSPRPTFLDVFMVNNLVFGGQNHYFSMGFGGSWYTYLGLLPPPRMPVSTRIIIFFNMESQAINLHLPPLASWEGGQPKLLYVSFIGEYLFSFSNTPWVEIHAVQRKRLSVSPRFSLTTPWHQKNHWCFFCT